MKKITVLLMCIVLFTTLTSIKGCEDKSAIGGGGGGGGTKPNSTATQRPVAPINGGIVFLGGAGIILGIVLLRKRKIASEL